MNNIRYLSELYQSVAISSCFGCLTDSYIIDVNSGPGSRFRPTAFFTFYW